MVTFARSICVGLLFGILFLVPPPIGATIIYDVSFLDPSGTFSSRYDEIRSHVLAAGADWARSFTGNASLEVQVRFDELLFLRAGGFSFTNAAVSMNNGRTVLQEGAAFEIATGMDVNGPSSPDIIVGFQPSHLPTLWFDPNPFSRTAPVPPDKTDAMTTITHELGHAFGFNGFRDRATGALLSTHESVYDSRIVFRNGIPFFVGALAGEVPLTFDSRLTQNIYHLGNIPPGPGSDLSDDLMNGIVFTDGRRYFISDLDVAILGDTGVPLVPEPTTLLLFGTTAAGLGLARWRQRRRGKHVAAAE